MPEYVLCRVKSMKKSYVSVLISVVKLELAAENILKMMDTG